MRVATLILHYGPVSITRPLAEALPDAIVVDNGSPEPYPGAQIVQSDLGFTRGWNAALRTVFDRYDAFWLLNNDVRFTAGDGQTLRRVLESDPAVGVIAPALPSPHRPLRRPRFGWQRSSARPVGFAELTAPLISKRLFEAVGRFDERFSRGYGVDFDFGFRCWRAGFRVAICDDVVGHHLSHAAIDAVHGFDAYWSAAVDEMYAGLLEKHGPRFFDPRDFPFWRIGGCETVAREALVEASRRSGVSSVFKFSPGLKLRSRLRSAVRSR